MDNKRIATGYDLEMQIKPEKLKCLIDRIINDALSANQEAKNLNLSLNTARGQFVPKDSDVIFEYPFTCQLEGTGALSSVLKITLSCEKIKGSWSIKPNLDANILGADMDISSLLGGDKIPSFALPFSNFEKAEIIAVPSSDNYASAIVLLADIDIAALLGLVSGSLSSDKNHDTTKAQSFLPSGADYVIGVSKSFFNSLSEQSFILAKKIFGHKDHTIDDLADNITIDLGSLKIKRASVSASKDTLKIIVPGKYDLPKTDKLDMSLKMIAALKFEIGEEGILQAQCKVDTKVESNGWYTALGTIIGLIFGGPVGGIVGIHTNSIIKKATQKLRKQLCRMVESELQSSKNYYYCSDDGVGKLRFQNGLINKLNCFFREPITLLQLSDSYFYQTWLAVKLKAIATFFDDNGATILGDFLVLDNHAVCNDVTLRSIQYYKSRRTPILVYEDIYNHVQNELDFEEALDTIQATECADLAIIDTDKKKKSRNAEGRLPMSILSFPVAVRRENNEIVAFEFDNGLIIKKDELIKLHKNHAVLIEHVKLVGSEGNEYFKTVSDKDKYNNLSYLPSISKEQMASIYYDE